MIHIILYTSCAAAKSDERELLVGASSTTSNPRIFFSGGIDSINLKKSYHNKHPGTRVPVCGNIEKSNTTESNEI